MGKKTLLGLGAAFILTPFQSLAAVDFDNDFRIVCMNADEAFIFQKKGEQFFFGRPFDRQTSNHKFKDKEKYILTRSTYYDWGVLNLSFKKPLEKLDSYRVYYRAELNIGRNKRNSNWITADIYVDKHDAALGNYNIGSCKREL